MAMQEIYLGGGETRLKPWQIARPLLYVTLELGGGTGGPFNGLNHFVARVADVGYDDVREARHRARSPEVRELVRGPDYIDRLNFDHPEMQRILGRETFTTASGIVLHRDALAGLVRDQLRIDADQRALHDRIAEIHKNAPSPGM